MHQCSRCHSFFRRIKDRSNLLPVQQIVDGINFGVNVVKSQRYFNMFRSKFIELPFVGEKVREQQHNIL